MTEQSTRLSGPISRRTLTAGVAWSLPAIAVAGAAPAMAASAEPALSLQGWVEIGKDCNSDSTDVLTINGTGGDSSSPPGSGRRGLWIFAPAPATNWTITNPRITFYYQTSLGSLSWSRVGSNANWSIPAVTTTVDPVIAGYTAYTTYYSGPFTFTDLPGTVNDYWLATGRPNFRATANLTNCNSNIPVYAQRTVTVNGSVITFRRGPVTL